MADRTLTVKIVGDAAVLQRSMRKAGSEADRFGSKMQGKASKGLSLLKLAGLGVAGAIGFGMVKGLKDSFNAAIEAEESQNRLHQALKNVGADTPGVTAQVNHMADSLSMLTGFDDEDLTNAFSALARQTGDAGASLKQMGLVTDLARAKHMSLEKASVLVGKVMNGNTAILKRYGIQVKDGASKQEVLAALQKRFSGAAKAYGETTKGSMDRAGVAIQNLEEVIGQKLAPAVAWLAEGAVKLINRFGPEVSRILNQVVQWVQVNWPKVRQVVERVMRALAPIVIPLLNNIKQTFKLIGAAIHGDWGKVWDALKQIVKNDLKALVEYIKLVLPLAKTAALKLGSAILNAISSGLGDLGSWIGGKLRDLKNALQNAPGHLRSAAVRIGSSILSAIGSGLGDLGGWLAGKVRGAVNAVISRVNSILTFHVSLDTHVPGVGKVGFGNTMNLPMLADGGVVNRPTLALIGEKGPEAVVPLNKGFGGMEIHFHQVPADADPQAIAAATAWRVRTIASA